MKIFDMHVHADGTTPAPEKMLAEMDKAGIVGGTVISNHPPQFNKNTGTSIEERLREVLLWSKGYEDRIFPVLWIHPDDENILEYIQKAVKEGIAAFKIICTDFFVYEEKCMVLLREIARLGKPVIFHSGILWDGAVSSEYNRPMTFEALLDIDGLRFSMGHCSWPWVDECVALYGKFLNAQTNGKTAEMFFDITPGTPELYRCDLLTKLYNIGYDVGDNIMFGLDSSAPAYRAEWAVNWLRIDEKILDGLGVSLKNREKLYGENLLRFLGKNDVKVEKAAPTPDDSHVWSAKNENVPEIIKKWYKELKFNSCFDSAFYLALKEIPVSDAITPEKYPLNSGDGRRNLLSHLFMAEGLEKRYNELEIPREILLDTLSDIRIWTETWSAVKSELYLGELWWLNRHMTGKLFRLGRLQFCMAGSEFDIPKYGIKKGDNVIEVHIPAGGKLSPEVCRASFEKAKEFFAKYFPNFKYTYFTCRSWLLDTKLKDYLPEGSGILTFADMFERVAEDNSNALLRYLFRWDTNETNVKYAYPTSFLAAKVQKAVLAGEQFHETLGVIKAE